MTLGSEKEKLEAEKADQDSIVKNLEGPENEAKEKFKQAWEGALEGVDCVVVCGLYGCGVVCGCGSL